jgi:uracil-DNA glycosylase family 4
MMNPPSFFDVVYGQSGPRSEIVGDQVVVPIDHPWMPKPGPDFLKTVAQLLARPKDEDDPESELVPPRIDPKNIPRDSEVGRALEQLYRSALYRRGWSLNVTYKGQPMQAGCLPGGRWDFPEAMLRRPRQDLVDGALTTMVGATYDPEDESQWIPVDRVRGPDGVAPAMLVGKHPGLEEYQRGQNFVGPASTDLYRVLTDLGVAPATMREWYVTNVLKHNRLDPTSGNLQQAWIANFLPVLYQEILLVRPRYIACLGTEAIKALLGKSYSVSNMAGRVMELVLRVPPPEAETQDDFDDLESYVDHRVQVVGIPHPAYVFRKPEAYADLKAGFAQFLNLLKGGRPPDLEAGLRHFAFYTERPLRRVVDDVIEANQERKYETEGDVPIAWDAEWHGKHWDDGGAYLRTLQFSTGPKHAVAIVLREQGGGIPTSKRFDDEVAYHVRRLLEGGPHSNPQLYHPIRTRHGGHWFKADIPWIRKFVHVDFEPYYRPPVAPRARFDLIRYTRDCKEAADSGRQDPPESAYFGEMAPHDLTRYEGGWDTGYMARAVFEALEGYGLEELAMRWTPCPRWDLGLEEAKKKLANNLGIKVKELLGYGDIPDADLLGYACYDADVTWRLFDMFNHHRSPGDVYGFLDWDVHEKSSREGFWRLQLAASTFMEMEVHGVTVDVQRGKELIAVFEQARDRMTEALRTRINWPTFNPNSGPQTRAWIFGNEYSGSRDSKTGQPKAILPETVAPLGLDPIKTTGKPPRPWKPIKDRQQESLFNPSVDKEVLGIYAWKYPNIKLLRDIKYVRQVLQTVLRPAKEGEIIGVGNDGAALHEELDEFDGGFLSYINPSDRKVRSRFYPVETGRCSSASPNMQNLAKQREDDYKRILGHVGKDGPEGDYIDILDRPLYDNPIRSIVTAGEWDDVPTVLLEFDIKSAEIAALAWEANDPVMIADVGRATLPEDHPDYLDLHSATAVEAFRLDCAPTKKALKAIGRAGVRVAAKNVRFGVPYGRSAEALARQCHEQGAADVTVKDCQRLIDQYHERYQATSLFLAACELRPYEPGFMVGAFGRRRRFQRVDDESIMADQGRQAKNFPIQNLVADAIMLCMYNLAEIRRREPAFAAMFRVVLQIHDAIMLEVKVPYIDVVHDVIIPECLGKPDKYKLGVPIMPRTLDGDPFCSAKLRQENDPRYRDAQDCYYFDFDPHVFLKWEQPIPPEVGRRMGIEERFLVA